MNFVQGEEGVALFDFGKTVFLTQAEAEAKLKELDAIRVMKAHGNTLIKIHGFWTYENCEFHEYHNGSNLMKFPIYNCRTTTLRVLARKNVIALDEDKGICKLN